MTFPRWLRKLLGMGAEAAVDALQRRADSPAPRKPLDVGERVRTIPSDQRDTPRERPRGLK